jgi:hypothetical protein
VSGTIEYRIARRRAEEERGANGVSGTIEYRIARRCAEEEGGDTFSSRVTAK